MKPFLRIPDESGDDVLIGVAQIVSVRYTATKRNGPEMGIIRMADGKVFEVRRALFDAELEALEPKPVAPAPPLEEKTHQKPVELVKTKRTTRKE